jgi:uncharacterized membrane protein YhiD involved in acid resistance
LRGAERHPEENLWMMACRGITMTVHLNATSLGIISLLVVITILYKLYKMVHKKSMKQVAWKINSLQNKEQEGVKQQGVNYVDEIKI